MHILIVIILALLIIYFISIAKVYREIPLIELKRRARDGQKMAKSLYKVASYKYSSQFFLMLIATIISAIFFLLVSKKSPVWVALITNLALIWLAYVWIPRSSMNVISQYLAQKSASPIGWALQYVHPIFARFNKKPKKIAHTGLYERSDIVRLLSAQQEQVDNRIEDFEIDLLKHVVGFNELRVVDIMTPTRKVNSISENELLGPIALSELHNTGHTYFPVYHGKQDNVVGILGIAGLVVPKNSITAGEAMNQNLYYVHEEQSLGEVLQLLIKTSQEMFIVVNSLQEYTGIVTGREVLKHLVGEIVTEEFDNYDKREIVANRFNLEVENDKEDETETNTTEDSTEVVE